MTTNPCAADPEAWFADGLRAKATRRREQAKAICRTCPARQACLDLAETRERGLPLKLRHGVWGGTDPERRWENDGKPGGLAKPIQHGTDGGYRAHKRRGEDACTACKQAASTAERQRKGRDAA